MFKLKSSSNGTGVLKHQIEKSADIISKKLSDSLKHAEHQIEDVRKYIQEHQDMARLAHFAKKDGGKVAISLLGVGLLAYGIHSLMKK